MSIGKYRMVFSFGACYINDIFGRYHDVFSGIYRDAEYSFLFCRKVYFRSLPLAIISFNPYADPISGAWIVKIRQIQCVGGKRNENPLYWLRWERMLVQIVVDWARKECFDRVEILPAKQSRWTDKAPLERLYVRYDVTAKRCGFRYDKNSETYMLSLTK